MARQALADRERGYGARGVTIDDDALEHLVEVAGRQVTLCGPTQ